MKSFLIMFNHKTRDITAAPPPPLVSGEAPGPGRAGRQCGSTPSLPASHILPNPPSLDRGLPNLMAAIGQAFGGGPQPAAPLPGLAQRLGEAEAIVLLVADGLGVAQLCRHLAGGCLHRACFDIIDSVYPPTTAAAVGTFLTGLPPLGHALTGWTQWCEEVGETLSILPLSRRGEGRPAPEAERWADRILDLPTFADRLPVPVTHVMPAWIAHSPFNRRLAGKVAQVPYHGTADLFPAIERALDAAKGRRFVYAYWPDYDSAAHDHGPDGEGAVAQLKQLEAALEAFVRRRRASQATLLVTADHGFIATSPQRRIDLADHPDLAACLLRPLTGERRTAYAHVVPERREFFAATLEARLGHALWVVPSETLVKAGWFGRCEPHPRFASRIGDFVLLLKEDWSLVDTRPGDHHPPLLGLHGGSSAAELRIPLCEFPLSSLGHASTRDAFARPFTPLGSPDRPSSHNN